jgi:hypothetical protein
MIGDPNCGLKFQHAHAVNQSRVRALRYGQDGVPLSCDPGWVVLQESKSVHHAPLTICSRVWRRPLTIELATR